MCQPPVNQKKAEGGGDAGAAAPATSRGGVASRSRRGRRDHDRGSPSQASSSVAQGMIQVDVNHYTALVTQAAQAQAAAQAMAAVTAPPHTAALPVSYGSKGQSQWTAKDSWQSDKWKGQSWKQGDWQQKNRWPQKKGGGDKEKWPKGWNKWERDEKAPGEGQAATPGIPLLLASTDPLDLPDAEEATEEDLSRQAQRDVEREDQAYAAYRAGPPLGGSSPECQGIGPDGAAQRLLEHDLDPGARRDLGRLSGSLQKGPERGRHLHARPDLPQACSSACSLLGWRKCVPCAPACQEQKGSSCLP